MNLRSSLQPPLARRDPSVAHRSATAWPRPGRAARALLAALGTAAATHSAQAQQVPAATATPTGTVAPLPATIEACYVPASGTVYRVNTVASPAPGAPAKCLSVTHVSFIWNQQGPAGAAGLPGPPGPQGDPGSAGMVGPDLTLPGALTMGKTGTFGGGLLATNGTPLAPPSGTGTRFMWLPQKAAVRAGTVNGSQWDDANIGDYSVALGRNTTASGPYSTALGYATTASGGYSTALGTNTTASGESSTALGSRVSTDGKMGAFMIGDGSTPTATLAGKDNEFTARFAGGYRMITNASLSQGCSISTTAQFSCTGGIAGAGLPLAASGAFDLGNTNGVQAVGTLGQGSTAIPSGAGTRFLWYPRKGAVRGGTAVSTEWNEGNIGNNSVAFGQQSTASGLAATAFGSGNRATGSFSTALGQFTTATGTASTALGAGTFATGTYSTALGESTTASGTTSTAIGYLATASGSYSTALGTRVSTNGQTGAFMIGDNTAGATMLSGTTNQFTARFVNGYRLHSHGSLTAGVVLAAGGGSWQSISDVRKKTAFRPVDGERLLARLAAIPVRTWQYRTQDAAIRHMGPTAQDFHAAFGVGESDTTITGVDADGVALAGVKALALRTRTQAATIAQLRTRLTRAESALAAIATLQRDVAALRAQLATLASAAPSAVPQAKVSTTRPGAERHTSPIRASDAGRR